MVSGIVHDIKRSEKLTGLNIDANLANDRLPALSWYPHIPIEGNGIA
jgi:hypothetical protein